jgi:hypothetical protein
MFAKDPIQFPARLVPPDKGGFVKAAVRHKNPILFRRIHDLDIPPDMGLLRNFFLKEVRLDADLQDGGVPRRIDATGICWAEGLQFTRPRSTATLQPGPWNPPILSLNPRNPPTKDRLGP